MSDSDSTEVSPTAPDAPVSDRYDIPNPTPFKESVAYTRTWVTEDLHPAFVDPGVRYDTNTDCFAAEPEEVYDEAALFDSQKAFADALQRFQEGIKPKYKSRVDLGAVHTWKEVMDYANEARNKYTGVQKRGIMKKIDHRLKTFQTAAPAIQAWLKLLPSTSIYGSVVCGGLTIILEVCLPECHCCTEADRNQAAVRLRQLRKETLNALDQMPLCIENAQHLIRTYGYPQVHQHVGRLYMAIMDALQHILEWYVRAAGRKFYQLGYLFGTYVNQ
ncbi:MAG: hypothetical protein L6R39_001190 [Caloplaca ligustica]|nr:MAG: hypothetical protein L6R39_001190 [Caloplaca ligustica]